MQVADISSSSFEGVAPDTEVGSIRSTLDTTDAEGVLVTDTDPPGVVTHHDVAGSRLAADAAVSRLATPVSALAPGDDVSEAARVLAANRSPVAPVREGNNLVGGVTRDAVLEAVLAAGADRLETTTVREAMSERVATVAPHATVGAASRDLRENGVDNLPVAEYGGELVGVVTRDDVASPAVDQLDAPPGHDRYPARPRRATDTVAAVMDGAAEPSCPGAPVATAVETMLQGGHEGVVVSPADTDRSTGVLTRTDVLRVLADDCPAIDLRVVNGNLLSTTPREAIASRLASLASPCPDDPRPRGAVRLEVTGDSHRERPVVQCVLRVWTGDAWLTKTTESIGAENALSLAVHRLERAVAEADRR